MRPPIENSYVIPGSTLAAGEYPGAKPDPGDVGARRKLARFLDAGFTAFVDLTQPVDPLTPYRSTLMAMAAARDIDVRHDRLGIADMGVCGTDHMTRVLDLIDARLAEGRRVYVHCWGGVGRTGMVVGCWLVRRGRSGEEALREVQALFDTMPKEKVERHRVTGSPQTDAQRAMVLGWHRYERARADRA